MIRNHALACAALAVWAACSPFHLLGQDPPETLPGTQPLQLDKPLDVAIVEGVDRFCLRQIELAREQRESKWARNYSSAAAHDESLAADRQRFREIIGAVDERRSAAGPDNNPGPRFEHLVKLTQNAAETGSARADNVTNGRQPIYRVETIQWAVLSGMTARGLALIPSRPDWKGSVVAIPDARWSADLFAGAMPEDGEPASHLPQILAENGFLVIVPFLISRDDEFSGTPGVAMTNQSHREWVYRSAFEVGRHVIGYEVQKVLAAVDILASMRLDANANGPIGVAGVGDGGQIALYAAALDTRIQSTLVSGYFQPREAVWREPIDRNVWKLLTKFGDAEIAGMIAPRSLVIEACAVPETHGPPPVKSGRRGGAAPGQIKTANLASVTSEFERAQAIFSGLKVQDRIQLVASGPDGQGANGASDAVAAFLK